MSSPHIHHCTIILRMVVKEDSGEEGRGEGKKKQSPSSPSEEEKMFKLTVSTADPAPACPPPASECVLMLERMMTELRVYVCVCASVTVCV